MSPVLSSGLETAAVGMSPCHGDPIDPIGDVAGFPVTIIQPGLCAVSGPDSIGGGGKPTAIAAEVDYEHLLTSVIDLRATLRLTSLAALNGVLELTVVVPNFIETPSLIWGSLLCGGVPVCVATLLFSMRRWPQSLQQIRESIHIPAAPVESGQQMPADAPQLTIEDHARNARLGYEGGFRGLELLAEHGNATASEAIAAIIKLIRVMNGAALLPLRLRAMQCLIRLAPSHRSLVNNCLELAEHDRIIGMSIVMRALDRRDSSGSYFNEMSLLRSVHILTDYYGEIGYEMAQYWQIDSIQRLVDLLLIDQISLTDLLRSHVEEFTASEWQILCEIVKADLVPLSH